MVMEVPRLHPDTIEEVKQRADIVDVVSEFVVLRKRGKDHVGLCPFHEERSPSFTVSSSKQMYYCFGCQAGGNAIKFLMEVGKRSFSEVVLDLARRYQVPIQTLAPEQRQELQRQLTLREQLYEILAVTTKFYEHTLRQPQGQKALDYLLKERLLTQETIQQFQLGYAPVGWEALHRYLVMDKGYPVQLVEQAGLIVSRKEGGGYYDRFRDRLMIPILDLQGRVIGFGGRSLGDELPKYLNSPDTELFDKGKTLFAFDKAKTAISKEDCAIVVEGYFDAISLHAAGIANVVASLGTALGIHQVRQLLRYTESKQIIFNFDADAAGTNAAERAIGEVSKLAYQGDVQLRILSIPDGKDPDEFLKKGHREQYLELIQTAPLWIDWQLDKTLIGKSLKQADHSQQITQAMVKILGNITNDTQLTHYINSCAELLSQGDSRRINLLSEMLLNQVVQTWQTLLKQDESIVPPGIVKNQIKSLQRKPVSLNNKQSKTNPLKTPAFQHDLLLKAEILLLKLYIHYPQFRSLIIQSLDERNVTITLEQHRFLWLKIMEFEEKLQKNNLDLVAKLQDLFLESPEKMATLSQFLLIDEQTERDLLRATDLIKASTACLERVIAEKLKRHYLELWKKADITNSRKQEYYQQFKEAQQRMIELDQELQFLYFCR